MYAKFIHDGKAVDFIPETDIPAGSVVVQGNLVGITKLDIKAGRLGALHVTGVFDVAKGDTAIPIGSKVYWDAGQNLATKDGNGIQIGIAVSDAAADDPNVRVKLHPIEDTNESFPAESRWRYGQVNIVEGLVPTNVAIAPGDLVYHESDRVRPASSSSVQSTKALSQSNFASKFLGVALDAKPLQQDGEELQTIRVATSGVFEYEATANTFVLGSYIGVEEKPERSGIEPQKVSTSTSDGSIGRVVRREPTMTDSVFVSIVSRIIPR